MAHHELGDHRKLRELARILDISRPMAVGLLQFLWWEVRKNKAVGRDGVLPGWDATTVTSAALWGGDSADFLKALAASGFIDMNDDHGGLAIHDYADWAPRYVQMRWARTHVRTTSAHVRTTSAHVRTTSAHVRTTSANVRDNETKRNVTKDKKEDPPTPQRGKIHPNFESGLWESDPPEYLESVIIRWTKLFPRISVPAEMTFALEWCRTNGKRGQKQDYERFLSTWLKRANDGASAVPIEDDPKANAKRADALAKKEREDWEAQREHRR